MSSSLSEDPAMMATRRPDQISTKAARLREILLGHLREIGPRDWPGTDGLTVDDVLREYPTASLVGLVPDRDELRRRYPQLGEEIDVFFSHDR